METQIQPALWRCLCRLAGRACRTGRPVGAIRSIGAIHSRRSRLSLGTCRSGGPSGASRSGRARRGSRSTHHDRGRLLCRRRLLRRSRLLCRRRYVDNSRCRLLLRAINDSADNRCRQHNDYEDDHGPVGVVCVYVRLIHAQFVVLPMFLVRTRLRGNL
jgi:hypothetical protein